MTDFLIPPHDDPIAILKWFIGFFVVLWVLWFIFIGPEQTSDRATKPYIKPATQNIPSELYGPSDIKKP